MKSLNNEIRVKIDDVGRVVIPKKLRESIDIYGESYLKIDLSENKLILTKYEEKFSKYINFAKIWNENYSDDTVIIVSNDDVLYICGNLKTKFLYEDINKEIFSFIMKDTFSYISLQSFELFKNCGCIDCQLIALRNDDINVGGIIFIYGSRPKTKNKFLFDILNNKNNVVDNLR